MPENMLSATEYMTRIKAYGRTDEAYLQWHVQRFLRTKALFDQRHPDDRDCQILDIGAHWLHQAMLYALDGHRLIAADVGGVLNVQSVRAMAADNNITLMRMGDLSDAGVFDDIDESSVDFVLFTEILEHLTFNPVGMWQAIQRVLKPTGEVIITTPNYYFWGSRAWDWSRFARRMGGGIPVADIIKQITHGHHWKEYSAREIVSYFDILPLNLYVQHMQYLNFNDEHRKRARGLASGCGRLLERRIDFFRDSIYAEIANYKEIAA